MSNIDMSQLVTAETRAAAQDAADWAGLVCSRLQGRLTLGAETCAALDAIAANPETPWAMRETILNASEWRCNSQAMDELAYLLGYSNAERLRLFRLAAQLPA